MTIPGHDYGVDTDRQLKSLNWNGPAQLPQYNIHAQRNADPVFAGRYFNPHVDVTWVDGETTNIKAANPKLAYVFPMQNPGGVHQTYRAQGMDHVIVEIDAPGKGARAGAVTVSSAGAITGIAVFDGGVGYTAAPAVHIASSAGTGAVATAKVNAQGVVTSINVTTGGTGYKASVRIIVTINSPPAGTTARAGTINLSPTGAITGVAVAHDGSGYTQAPKVVIRGGDSAAKATTTIAAGKVTSITVTEGGSGYKHGLIIDIDPPPPGGKAARAGAATLSPAGAINKIPVQRIGSGYATPPAVRITGDIGAGATARSTINAAGEVTAITITAGGAYRFANPDFVRKWGEVDAIATCSRIWDVVKGGELLFPDPRSVIVYLDIEAGVILRPDYWYGWASAVYWFCTGFFQWPFYAGLYCTTQHNPTGNNVLHRIPSDDVQNGLTHPPNDSTSRCCGIFATNPQVDHRYDVGFQPDWKDRFDEWTQTVHVIFGLFPWDFKVKVLLWQYGMQESTAPAPFIALHIDLDETSPSGEATSRMLKIP